MNTSDSALIRQLVEDYAAAADDADGAAGASLFAPGGVMHIHRPSGSSTTRAQDMPRVWQGLSSYVTTSHVIAHHQSAVTGNNATARTRCVAHHPTHESTDLVMHIRYDDVLTKIDGRWLFSERNLHMLAVVTNAAL